MRASIADRVLGDVRRGVHRAEVGHEVARVVALVGRDRDAVPARESFDHHQGRIPFPMTVGGRDV